VNRTRYIAQAGVIAAVYATATVAIQYLPAGLGWGPIQFRISEAVTVLGFFTPAAIPGLTLGSVVANALNPYAVWPLSLLDVIFGSLGTFIGAVWMWRFRDKTALGLLGPVISNALIVPAYLPWLVKGLGIYQIPLLGIDLEGAWLPMYLFGVVTVGLGQAVVMYGLGWPLLSAFRRLGVSEVL